MRALSGAARQHLAPRHGLAAAEPAAFGPGHGPPFPLHFWCTNPAINLTSVTSRPLHAVLLAPGTGAGRLMEALAAALDGSGPAILPLDRDPAQGAARRAPRGVRACQHRDKPGISTGLGSRSPHAGQRPRSGCRRRRRCRARHLWVDRAAEGRRTHRRSADRVGHRVASQAGRRSPASDGCAACRCTISPASGSSSARCWRARRP